MDIFDRNAIRQHQLSTWKRDDVPVEVLPEMGKRVEFPNLAEAQKVYPDLNLNRGMRGKFGGVEYCLRFELYTLK